MRSDVNFNSSETLSQSCPSVIALISVMLNSMISGLATRHSIVSVTKGYKMEPWTSLTHGRSLRYLALLLSAVSKDLTVDGIGMMVGADFEVGVGAGAAVAVAEVAVHLRIGTGVMTLAGIAIAGALKIITGVVGAVAVAVAEVATETDLIPAVVGLVRVLVRITSQRTSLHTTNPHQQYLNITSPRQQPLSTTSLRQQPLSITSPRQ